MTLAGRFSTLFLSLLGFVLAGFSGGLYLSAWIHLDRQIDDRLSTALAVLAAAAEVHENGVEWEPAERVLTMGQESGRERLRWMVFDEHGRRIDQSRNLSDEELTPAWVPYPLGSAKLPIRLIDRRGQKWRLAQRRVIGLKPVEQSVRADLVPSNGTDLSGQVHPYLVLTVCAPVGPTEATLGTLGWFLVTSSGVVWLVAVFACHRLSRRALAPLRRMVVSARGLDAADVGWALEDAGTGDELDELGRSFNQLLARLHGAYERQRRFSCDASHQLRTPLTILIGQLEVALRQERSEEEYRRALKSAFGRAVQLGQIVDALTFLSRNELDVDSPGCEYMDLSQWVLEHLGSGLATGRLNDITYESPGVNGLWIQAHRALLGQLLNNLLDNASKYSEAGTAITVETIRQGNEIVLAVTDCGMGIAEEDLALLFEPFYRSDKVRRQGISGTGLGLAVVQRIATALGAKVSVVSNVGRGSRFMIRFKQVVPSDG